TSWNRPGGRAASAIASCHAAPKHVKSAPGSVLGLRVAAVITSLGLPMALAQPIQDAPLPEHAPPSPASESPPAPEPPAASEPPPASESPAASEPPPAPQPPPASELYPASEPPPAPSA